MPEKARGKYGEEWSGFEVTSDHSYICPWEKRSVRLELERNDGNGIHLHQKIRVCQPPDIDARDDGWVWLISPELLESRKTRLQGLSLDQVDVPFDDMLRPGSCCSEGSAQVEEDLVRLSGEVSFPDDSAPFVNSILPANVDRSCRSCDGDHLCKRRIFMQSLRVEMVYEPWIGLPSGFWFIGGASLCLYASGCVPHCLLSSLFQ